MTVSIPELYWDPFDTEIDSDPYALWQRLRDEAPVYRNDKYDFYALSRFADVEAAHRDPKTFSSAHATVLELMTPEPATHGQMIFLDPPEHTRLRALVSRAFTPRRMGAIEEHVRELCCELLDAQLDSDGFDYVQDFGAQLPSRVISSLIGAPPDERERMRELIDQIFHIEPGVGMINDVSLQAQIQIHKLLMRWLADRDENPIDDMLTDLVRAEVTDDAGAVRRLSRQESADFANLLISAGTETVARFLGWAAILLEGHPGQRADLAERPELIANAVEEVLRFEAPSPVQGRWTTCDVEVAGEIVPKNSKVLLLTGSAGRDERKYPNAHEFDVHREFDHHVSFGHGIHFCIGAALARMEARIALEETLKRWPTWDVDHPGCVRQHTSTVRGWSHVPITTRRSA